MSLQTEIPHSLDAGLTVFIQLLRFHGLSVDPEQVRHRFGGIPIGTSEMLRFAKQTDLKARICSTSFERLNKLALPGIATGVILSTSRAIGEAAPLIMLGALTFTSMVPGSIDSPIKLVTRPSQVLHAPLDQFTAMPIEIYDWSRQIDSRFTAVAASGIVVLLAVLLSINAVAMVVRYYASRRLKW